MNYYRKTINNTADDVKFKMRIAQCDHLIIGICTFFIAPIIKWLKMVTL